MRGNCPARLHGEADTSKPGSSREVNGGHPGFAFASRGESSMSGTTASWTSRRLSAPRTARRETRRRPHFALCPLRRTDFRRGSNGRPSPYRVAFASLWCGGVGCVAVPSRQNAYLGQWVHLNPMQLAACRLREGSADSRQAWNSYAVRQLNWLVRWTVVESARLSPDDVEAWRLLRHRQRSFRETENGQDIG